MEPEGLNTESPNAKYEIRFHPDFLKNPLHWDYCLLEIYCFDPDCNRPLIDHLEHNQGSWCEGDLRGFLYYAIGLRLFLRHYLAELWENLYGELRWYFWKRWTFNDEAFQKWVEERTLKPGQCSIVENWPKCEFPESPKSDSEA